MAADPNDYNAIWDRLHALEAAVNSVLDQSLDEICWMDVYTKLAGLVGREYDPAKLPRHAFEANCKRFAASLYEAKPYDSGPLVRVVAEHQQAKQMLRDAGFGVTGTPLVATVKEALEELKRLRDYEDDMRNQGIERDLLT